MKVALAKFFSYDKYTLFVSPFLSLYLKSIIGYVEVTEVLYCLLVSFWTTQGNIDGFQAGVVADKLEEELPDLISRYPHWEELLTESLDFFRKRFLNPNHNFIES
jgi:hypothetical protein